jgi:hypothetical protein
VGKTVSVTATDAPVARHIVKAQRGRFGRSLGILLMSTGSVGVLLASAVFTDTESVGSNTFSTRTIDISTNPASAVVAFANMMPGDTITAPITVTNAAGSDPVRYAVKSTTTGSATLPAQLDLTIRTGITAQNCTDADFTGATTLYNAGDLGSAAGTNVLGDPAQGYQAGDRPGPNAAAGLAAGGSEILCFTVSLPIATGNTFKSLTTTATFDFTAEQTKNNQS